MANSQTEHYGLNQWAAEDPVLREEFNRDNKTIDTQIASLHGMAELYPIILVGTYSGTGNTDNQNFIALNRLPKVLLIMNKNGENAEFGCIIEETGVYKSGNSSVGIPLNVIRTEKGISWSSKYAQSSLNAEWNQYVYFMLC